MSIFESKGLNISYLTERLNDLGHPFASLPTGWDAPFGGFGSSSEFNDNVIANNAAILLTDNAQSTVNFLYINPIEFFNNGRASDIYLDISVPSDGPEAAETQQKSDEIPPLATQVSEQSDIDHQVDDNLIGNNAAILLTDDAQSAINFIYVNPIEFFNNGRAGDIYLDISVPSGESEVPDAAPVNEGAQSAEKASDEQIDHQINDNLIGNNAAILLTDDAQSTVNFLYINPIEFFNNGRASDIYININGEGAVPAEAAQGALGIADGTAKQDAPSPASMALNSPQSNDGGLFAEVFDDRALELLETLDFSAADAFAFLESLERPDPLTFLSDLVPARDFNPEDFFTSDLVDAFAGLSGDSSQINDNVVGNNAAILLTDNAQSTVNFLYVNPIQFFNDGRGGDIYLDLTLGPNDELFIL